MKMPEARYKLTVVAAAVLLAGCATKQEIMTDVHRSRRAAVGEWQREKEQEARSETYISGELCLADALKLSLAYNKQLQAAVQEKAVAEGRIVESYSEALPRVDTNVDYTRLDRVNSFEIGSGEEVSLGFLDNYSANLAVTQPLYRGGAIGAALRAARVYSLLSDEVVRSRYQQTIYEVAAAYFESLLAGQLYEANKDAVESARAQLEEVKARRAEGLASEFDVLRAQVDVSNFQAEMIQQKNRINLARTRLFKVMGVSQQSTVTLSDELKYSPVEMNMESAVRVAFENRPDLYEAELSIRLQQEAVTAARARYWPDIDAFFNQQWARPDPHRSTLNEWDDAWRAGLTLQWPLFAGLSREGQLIQEKAKLKQTKYRLADTQEQALLEIQQALLSLQDACELVESQKLNLQRAREGLRLAEVGYREGVNTEVEITDARAALTRARSLYYQAIYQHTIAALDLQRAMGVLGEPKEDSESRLEPPEQLKSALTPKQPSGVLVSPSGIGEGDDSAAAAE